MFALRFLRTLTVIHAIAWTGGNTLAVEGLFFREDTRPTPPELPINQDHVAYPGLALHLYGPGGNSVKKSYHENRRNDPHYIYSGTARQGPWALALEKEGSVADLSGREARVRLRTRNRERTLHIILRTPGGWITSRQGIGATEDQWTITTLKIAELDWNEFDSTAIRRGAPVARPNLRQVSQIGFTDFEPGEGSTACSRIDWIEVWERLPSSALYVVPNVEGYDVYEGDDFVLRYQTRTRSFEDRHHRANYIHPLMGLHGEEITEDFPDSHRHQRGIFWAWHQTYVGGLPVGNSWTCTDFEWDVRNVRILYDDSNSVGIEAAVDWKSPLWEDGTRPFVREFVTIRPHRRTAEGRKIDFTLSLLALAPDVTLGGAPNDRGYGGLTARIATPPNTSFTGATGPVVPEILSVEGGAWMNLSGELDGKPYAMAIAQHPSNPDFPQRWILRNNDRWSNNQNPVWPGPDPVLLPTTDPVTLRYRLVVHRGDADLDKAAAAFAER